MKKTIFSLLLVVLVTAGVADGKQQKHFPDLPEYQTLLCDFHTHTVFSDGYVWPTVRVGEAVLEGLDAVSITDHIEYQPHKKDIPTNHNRPYELSAKTAEDHGIILIRGAEITRDTPPGHYNAIYLTDIDELEQDDLLSVFETAKRQGGFVFWNHHEWQGASKGDWTDLQTQMVDKQWLHGMEVANGNTYYSRAHQWCLDRNLTMLGNSDIHTPARWNEYKPDDHRTLTLVFSKERSAGGVRQALDQGRTAVWCKNQLIGRREYLEPLFHAAVEVGSVYRKGDNAWIDITNKTGMNLMLVLASEQIVVPALSTQPVKIEDDQLAELPVRVENFLVAPNEGLKTQLKIESKMPTFLLGGDISMLTRMEQLGVRFKDQGDEKDLIQLMRDNGSNCFRLRLFVNPTGRNAVIQDVPYTIELAKRIKQSGSVFLLDFHYSDTWADPGKQYKPKAWENLTFDQLAAKIETYTAEVIAAFKKENVLPDIVQIGNEIDPGFLWPDGQLYKGDPDQKWEQFTTLLKSAIRGIQNTAGPAGRPRVMIHISCGGNQEKTQHFFRNLEKHGVSYDIIGLSYYPWWHGTLADLEANLNHTAAAFNKDILVTETAYPNREMTFDDATYKDTLVWSKTPEGQKQFLDQVIQTVRQTPDGRGIGVLYWYPESVPVNGLHVWNNGGTALFDKDANTLPAMKSFQLQ